MTQATLMVGTAGLALVLGLAGAGEAREVPAQAGLDGARGEGYWQYDEVTTDQEIAAF